MAVDQPRRQVEPFAIDDLDVSGTFAGALAAVGFVSDGSRPLSAGPESRELTPLQKGVA
jgi:hypothetical protein